MLSQGCHPASNIPICIRCCNSTSIFTRTCEVFVLQINVTVSNHLRDIPEFTGSWSVKYEVLPDASREQLTAAWKAWMEETCKRKRLYGTL